MTDEELQVIKDRLTATELDPFIIEVRRGCVPALVAEVERLRAELGRAQAALAALVEASDEASDFISGEAVSAFNAALGAARGVLGDPE